MTLPVIILVSPQLGENIGGCARIMSNFGLKELRIVAPRDNWPNKKAEELAANGIAVIQDAKIFPTIEEAIADLTLVFATSAQKRYMVKSVIYPEHAIKLAIKKIETEKIGFMFGRERSGLTNNELTFSDYIITIPVSKSNKSLNLSHAVGIICYEFLKAISKPKKDDLRDNIISKLATKGEIEVFFKTLEAKLSTKGFFKTKDIEPTMRRNIRNMFLKAELTEQDIRTLHGIITALSKQ